MNFQRIICGVDFSPMSVTAFRAAADLARSAHAELHLVHIIETSPKTPALPLDGHGPSLEQKATDAMNALVTSWASALDGVSVTTEITAGLAPVELRNRVRDPARDLIVVGANGVT